MWQTIGHDWAIDLLARAIAAGRVAHSYLLTGPANIGKTHLATEFAAALNCSDTAPPCGRCSTCTRIARGTHPDVTVVGADGGKLKIDQVRDLQRTVTLSPYEARWRVCVITDFETATSEAANAFLKTLEEPPPRVVLVLTSIDASLLLPTIVSRCQVFPLRAVPLRQVEDALVALWQVERSQAQTLAHLSAGRVGWAIRAAQDPALLAGRRQDIETLDQLLHAGRAARIAAAEHLCARQDMPDLLRLWQMWWRDIALTISGCQELLFNADYGDLLRQQAEHSDLVTAEMAVRATETALVALEQNANQRLALEVLLLGWPHTEAV